MSDPKPPGKIPLTRLSEDLSNNYGEGGLIDVVNNYDWTLAPATELARDKVPIMFLKQYEMDENALQASLKYWTRPLVSSSARSNPYAGLYRAESTGVEFKFPWFETYNHHITQNWSDYSGGVSFAKKLGEKYSQLTNTPGVSINTPKVWKGSGRAEISYNITLFNTTGSRSEESIKKNKQLINRLISSTLHDQISHVTASPPAIYTLSIPGVRYSPACTISSISVENIGTMIRRNQEAIPEAYKVTFILSELISESRQIFEGKSAITAILGNLESDKLYQEEEKARDAVNKAVPPVVPSLPPIDNSTTSINGGNQ